MSTINKGLIASLIIITLLIGIFWGRISGAYKIYSLVDKVTYYLNNGSDSYNLLLTGTFGDEKSADTANILISYDESNYFLADVTLKQKHFIIKSETDSTLVFIGPSNLIVAAEGKDIGNFNAIKLLGNILKDYPQYNNIPQMSFVKKLGIAGWTFFNSSFSEGENEGREYRIITFPINSSEIQLWLNNEKSESYNLISKSKKNNFNIKISINKNLFKTDIPRNKETKIISVERKELNTAIQRGALRAGGLFLENNDPPKVDEKERSYGKGVLKYKNGNRLFLAKGTHKEIGEAHGALLKTEVRKMIDATLYTICWVYTASRKSWFIDDLRGAYEREAPFIPERFQEEMIGLANTSGISIDEIRLTNVFPALFHCSGFAVFDSATVGGTLYHGRVLDYITELGLQYYSVVSVIKPNGYNAFVNVGFAGFIGSVTGMNEHQVSFGEMGGGGEGDWDGMPMALLMREGLEKANTLNEAVNIFKVTPRTCEYYYVIADGKIPDARGLATSPSRFEVIHPNEYHKQLTKPIKDAVLMSAGSRYEKLVERVKENYGKIDAEKAIRLMDRPVAMKSNLHNALFAPQSLELWVSNAGPQTPASSEPYTYYDFKKLLDELINY